MSFQGRQLKQYVDNGFTEDKIVSGERAMKLLNHGCDVTLSVKTPLGSRYRIETTFIGSNSQNILFFELPSVLHVDISNYFEAGFRVSIKAISDRGEGAVIHFQTFVHDVVSKPFRLLAVAMPHNAHLLPLRNEPRFDVMLKAAVLSSSRDIVVNLTDISANGCGFTSDYNGPSFSQGTKLNLLINKPNSSESYQLSGLIMNNQKRGATKQYGLQFDIAGTEKAKLLMAQLIFDGSQLSFKKTQAS
ncbi:PilZ domain-containing protein [Photobacterium minamisatsumaniensis]|uniref:PilZ domain-containing protein n=1 Tax=Photobacterium minamisatsumaniensis TaxID=2910233 RepID=UPI003D0A2F13